MNLPIIFRSISKIFRFPEFLSLDGSSDIRSGSSDEKFEFALFMPHMPVLRTKNAGWGHLSGGNGSPPPWSKILRFDGGGNNKNNPGVANFAMRG